MDRPISDQTPWSVLLFVVSLVLFGCSESGSPSGEEENSEGVELNCDSTPVTPLPENFSSTKYWELNSDLQGVFPLTDSVELARHYCKYGAEAGLDFGDEPIYSSAADPLSSQIEVASSKKQKSSSSSEKETPLNCDSDPVTPLPENFSSTKYWVLNSDLQLVFAQDDSVAMARHYCKYGADEERDFGDEPVYPSSSSKETVSSNGDHPLSSSSQTVSSSSIPIGTCLRQLVPNAYFKFTNNDTQGGVPILRGWNEGNIWKFFAGDWVVPQGYDCDYRIQVGAHLLDDNGTTGDTHNLYPIAVWRGNNIDSTLVEKVTIYSGETLSSFEGYSSVIRSSSSVQTVSSSSITIPLSSSVQTISSSSTTIPISSSTTSGHCVLNWFTESMFNSFFPNRHSNYTWAAFKEALVMVPDFICGSGRDEASQKQEMAAVFAHWKQEVADLVYIEEICGTQGSCLDNYNSDWSNGQWPPQPGKSYHGRGAKQISWPGNYGEASQFLFGDKMVLLSAPERVKNEGKLAFATSFWFWWARGCDVGFWNTGFGATTQIINGAIECGSNYSTQAQARETYYGQYLSRLGVSDSRSKRTGC